MVTFIVFAIASLLAGRYAVHVFDSRILVEGLSRNAQNGAILLVVMGALISALSGNIFPLQATGSVAIFAIAFYSGHRYWSASN